MNEEFPYQTSWTEYRKRRNAPFFIFGGGIAVHLLLQYSAMYLFPKSLEVSVFLTVLLLTLGALVFYSEFRFQRFICPDCGDRFHRRSFWITSPIFRSECMNCGFQKYWGSSFYKFNMMKVKVLFFGATAESVGESEVELDVKEGTDSVTILDYIFAEFPALSKNHKRELLHFSVNQEYALENQAINDGDELAVFTAVSGG